jgi:hypothetical protein
MDIVHVVQFNGTGFSSSMHVIVFPYSAANNDALSKGLFLLARNGVKVSDIREII